MHDKRQKTVGVLIFQNVALAHNFFCGQGQHDQNLLNCVMSNHLLAFTYNKDYSLSQKQVPVENSCVQGGPLSVNTVYQQKDCESNFRVK